MTHRRSKPRGLRGRVAGWMAWFGVLNLVWLVFVSTWSLEEAILGLFAAAIAATAAEAVREQGVAGFRPRAGWLWQARVLPWRAARETCVVLAILARLLTGRGHVRSRFRVLPVSLPEDPYEQAAKRALLVAGESFAPNSYVLAIDTRKGLMLTHELLADDAH
jgi:multisubunit Na+/H+ antiporter MnhE subunit